MSSPVKEERSSELKTVLWFIGGVILIGFLYLQASFVKLRIGFPLDDAWIHQTYARNLVALGQWAYIPGQPSSGSTSPMWTVLLSIGYIFASGVPYLWTFLIGGVSLFITAFFGEKISRVLAEAHYSKAIPAAGLFLICEWHLGWAAFSGMETLFYAACILIVFFSLIEIRPNWLLIGLEIGILIWLRPDSVTLLGPAVFILFFESIKDGDWRKAILQYGKLSLGFALFFVPYLIFNQILSGEWWPNTFYAKQNEYAVLLNTPLIKRIGVLLSQTLIGPGVLLLPGFLYKTYLFIKKREFSGIAMVLWFVGFCAVYAVRLPVVYQHARYLIPAMPVYFVIGFSGFIEIIGQIDVKKRLPRMIKLIWIGCLVALTTGFVILGSRAYSQDVAVIESEMVEVAKWADRNLPPDALLAVHDIGAIGYYSNRELIDLAGLITPEVAGFIRDEERLADFITEKDADYLITFPDWYMHLTTERPVIYQTSGTFSLEAGGSNMTIYTWK
jgi:hypothetical protein